PSSTRRSRSSAPPKRKSDKRAAAGSKHKTNSTRRASHSRMQSAGGNAAETAPPDPRARVHVEPLDAEPDRRRGRNTGLLQRGGRGGRRQPLLRDLRNSAR